MGTFRELKVWQRSKDIAVKIYSLTRNDRFKKDFGLTDQMRRAAVSIASNIAEGDERFSNKESIRFLYIANASLAELITQLIISYEIGYVAKSEVDVLIDELGQISKMIKTLIKFRKENDNR